MLLYCFASLRSFLSLLVFFPVCCLYYTGRKIKTLKPQTFKNPLLISISRRQTKIFKNLCKKICQY